MTDDLALPPPPRHFKRIAIYAGAGIAIVSILMATLALVVVKVEKVHVLWCGKVGLLCVKVPEKPVVVAPPGGCPGPKMAGTLRGRRPKDQPWSINADIIGHVTMNRDNAAATGDSTVACFGHEFLATLTNMSHGIVYQCMGAIDGQAFTGVCNLSATGPNDISGHFID